MPTSKAQPPSQVMRHYLQRDQGFFKAEVYITRLANGERVVCKDYSRFSGHWNAPLARWLARRETRLLERLQDWPHAPRVYPCATSPATYSAKTSAGGTTSCLDQSMANGSVANWDGSMADASMADSSMADSSMADSSMIVQMEYISGELLAHQSHEHSVVIYQKLFSALLELHRKGIVHNDIRGTNVLLRNGTPVFIDFTSACSLPQLLGVAKLARLLRLFDLRHLIKIKRNLGIPLSRREAHLRKRSNGIQNLLNVWKKGLLPRLKQHKQKHYS